MGIRLHRAMGWGIRFESFKQHINILGDITACNYLEKKFSKLTVKDLTYVPNRVMDMLKFNPDDARPYPVVIPNLLALKYYEPTEEVETGDPNDLCTVTDGGDKLDWVIFYPNLYYRNKWYRVNDDLDYAFEQAVKTDELDQDVELREFTKELKFNHYPWTNSLMDKDGNPIHWRGFHDLKTGADDWAPAVPAEIRWYLTEHDILPLAGVNELRPIVAQYWC